MPAKILNFQLKELSQLTDACWAAWLEHGASGWRVRGAHQLPQKMQTILLEYSARPLINTWLSGALANGRGRNRALSNADLKCRKLFAFPGSKGQNILLIGANKLDPKSQRMWRALALSNPADDDAGDALGRNLKLIHKVVQRVIGLGDIAEVARIASDLIAKNFGYELAVVLLADDNNNLIVRGIGGTAAKAVRRGLSDLQARGAVSITSQVFQTGRSLLIGDVADHPLYLPIPGWDAGSEMCVALSDGEKIFGIIDVESSEPGAFTKTDLLAMEALAGILASVISSAGHYQKLQETVSQLQETQQELQATIGAQHEAEARLIQAAKLAAVGEMAAGVAHELNNPLTTVVGFTEMLVEDMPDESPQKSDLSLVLREARRARSVVRRLLDFARQSETVRVRADMNELVEDALTLTKHLLRTSGIDLVVFLEKDLPWVLMDRNQIKQVILNLTNNALHAMPSGGKLILETARHNRHGKDGVLFRVQDTGVGIPPEHMERIFEPFFTTRASEGGTGLGLSVTYGIVGDHQGAIEVESTVNIGSTFTVWLPLEAASA
jgi:signal transduction histidine kinase